LLLIGALCVARPAAAEAPQGPPLVAMTERGAVIEDVTIESYGVAKPQLVRRYLSLRKGDRLEQSGVDRDFANLSRLRGMIPRLTIEQDPITGGVTLHWIVMAKLLSLTTHPIYLDQPLAFPIQGVGFDLTSAPLDRRDSYVEGYSQLTRRADLGQIFYKTPVEIDAMKGRESDIVLALLGAKGVYRASMPFAVNIYSFFSGAEAFYLVHAAGGSQAEFGIRAARSTSDRPTYIVAPSLYDTYDTPARTTSLLAGLSHGCPVPPTQWHPPFCSIQYKVVVSDAIGALGATSEYQTYVADAAQYVRFGSSTVALHEALAQSGGVLPTSAIICGNGLRGYPKAFCGTDARVLQAEYRIGDALPGNLKFFVFTETAASRVRGGHQAFAPPNFRWNADSGVGIMYKGVRFDLAYGSEGGRLTFELLGQLF
jgi:hypothetical protein